MTQHTRMNNGVRVITEHVPSVRSAGISVLIDAGPQDEPSDKSGLAHLCEHAIFLGTPQRNARELAQTMDAAGGCFGAFTAPDYTCVYAHVLEDYVTYALDLLGDILVESTVEVECLAREKEVICKEILSYQEDPEDRTLQMVKDCLWPNDPLSRSVLGSAAEVMTLERDDVMQFLSRFYTPSRIIVAAAGAVDHQSIVEQVEDAFWNLKDDCCPQGSSNEKVTPAVGRVSCCKMNTSQCYFTLAIPALAYDDRRRYAMHVLCNLLGGGMSSRLFQSLRERSGLVYSVHSTLLSYRRGGALLIQGATSPEQLIQCINQALSEVILLSVGDLPVDADELWKSKMQVRSQSRLATDMISNRVSSIATQEFHFGKRIPDDAILAAIDAVQLSDIQQVAEEVLLGGLEGLTIAAAGSLESSLSDELKDLHNNYSSIWRKTDTNDALTAKLF